MRSLRRLALLTAIPAAMLVSACTPVPPASTVAGVDLNRYLGTWYEIASVKQFFSVGLVGSRAEYSLNPDGSVRVFNSGTYLAFDGPTSSIVGAAVALDPSNSRLNVSFNGPPSTTGPGNYWIVDLDPEYQWAIVSDPTGRSGFILSRTRAVSPELRADLLRRAADKGVDVANMTDTPQPPA